MKSRVDQIMGQRRRVVRIAFAWQTLTCENLGVSALAQSQITIAKTAAKRHGLDIECVEFCPTGPNSDLALELGCEIADPLSLKGILTGRSQYVRQLRRCDVVLDISAGDSFSDIYGKKHFFFLSLSKLIALWLGKPLIFCPQTIGPFYSPWAKRLSTYLLKHSEQVFARDGLSMNYLRENILEANAQEVIDVAFRLPFNKVSFPENGKTKIGLNVSGLLMNGGYSRNNQFGLKADYCDLLKQLISKFVSMTDVEVHLIAHVLADSLPVDDDYAAIMALKEAYPEIIVAPKFRTPSDAKSYITGMDFFSGARMHACIGAFSGGVPVVPMAYSRKFNGLFNSLGYRHIADLKNEDTETAFNKVIDGFKNRSNLKNDIDEGNLIANEKLQNYEDYLAGLFQRITLTKGLERS